MTVSRNAQIDFDVAALFDALDARRRDWMLTWQGVARELWGSVHNAQRPILLVRFIRSDDLPVLMLGYRI